MSNISIFGTTQCGKTTLAGYLISRSLSDVAFNEMVRYNRRLIEKMGFNASNRDLVYTSFVSLDRDELRRETDKMKKQESSKENTDRIGTSRRTHRKLIELNDGYGGNMQKLVMIDTPGMRAEAKERYMGIFEGDIGICVLNIIDLENYMMLEHSLQDFRKIKLMDRQLFDPIRFWCAYKSIKNLILLISKIDLADFDKSRIDGAIHFLLDKIESYDLPIPENGIPIIPISIRLWEDNQHFIREAHNIDRVDDMCPPLHGQALLPVVSGMENNKPSVERQTELFANVSKLCKIRDRNGHALRVKVLHQTLHTDSKITIGPLKNKEDGTFHFVTGAIKSLKEEGAIDITSSLKTGSIGGVAIPLVYDNSYTVQPPASKIQKITDYSVLKTSILFGGKVVSGNSITVSVPKCELGNNALMAIDSLLPKESIHFFWLGRQIVAELIELYEDEESCFLTLHPLAQEYQDAIGKFTVPRNQMGKPESFDVLLMLQLRRKIGNKMETVYRNYINFRLLDIYDIQKQETYKLHLWLGDEDLEYLFEDFGDELSTVTNNYRLDQKRHEIVISNLTAGNIGLILKSIRNYLREHGIIKYMLKLER